MKILILPILVLPICQSFAQNTAIDSLKKELRLAKSDTTIASVYIQMSSAAEDSTAISYSDSAQRIINRLLQNSEGRAETALYNYLFDAVYYKGIYYANTEVYDSAIHFLNAAMQSALRVKNRKQEALTLNDIGICYYYKNDIANTLDYLKRSLAIREELKDEVELRNAYNNMAFIHKEVGLIESSLDFNFKSLALAEKQKNDGDIAISLNNIGQVYHEELLDYAKGLEYYKKSLAIRERNGSKKDIGLIKNNIATVYGDMGNSPEAIRYFTESLELRRAANHKYGIVQTLSNLAFNYIEVKDYEKAKSALAESMQLNKSLQDISLEEAIHYNYAKLYDTLHMPDSAIYHASRSQDICLELGNPLDISKSSLLLSNLYQKEGNYNKALAFYKTYKKMQDSILNDNLKKQGLKSEMEYEYLKKKTESDMLHDEQIAKRNLYTWLLVVLFIASALIGFVLYKRYKLKQQLKEVQLRNKIAGDLHDDVGATLSSIRMYSNIVSGQVKDRSPQSAELLEKISNNSKEMIENMSDIVWMIKPGNDDFKNIENRMLNFANELCAPAGINFEFNKDDSTNAVQIPMEHRRDIYLIFKEAVNNAVKYSGCHNIHAGIFLKDHFLELRISDDGDGFDMDAAKNGNGLSNMQKRATTHKGTLTIQSAAGEGTEIIAAFIMR